MEPLVLVAVYYILDAPRACNSLDVTRLCCCLVVLQNHFSLRLSSRMRLQISIGRQGSNAHVCRPYLPCRRHHSALSLTALHARELYNIMSYSDLYDSCLEYFVFSCGFGVTEDEGHSRHYDDAIWFVWGVVLQYRRYNAGARHLLPESRRFRLTSKT